MSSACMRAKRPLKWLVAALKGVTIQGDASVDWRANVRGPGRALLEDGARIGRQVDIDLRGGELCLAKGAAIPLSAIVRVGNRVEIGADTTVMHYTIIYGEGGVTIGERCLVGNHCLIASTTHLHEGRDPIIEQGMRTAPVVIGDHVWVGGHSIIDVGVTIGEGAIIAAHSYVREDVPAYAVVGGVPARVLKMRDEADSA